MTARGGLLSLPIMPMEAPAVLYTIQPVLSTQEPMKTGWSAVLNMIPSSKRGGRNPFIFAVSAAYASDRLIAKEHDKRSVMTQKLVSSATQVAEYSIRDHFGMIKKIIELAPITT